MNLNLSSIAAIMLLTACAVTPDYQQPKTLLPERFSTEDLSTTSSVQQNWWRLYRDPELDQLVSSTLTYNTDLAMAVARIQEADANLKIAGASLLPTVNLAGAASRSGVSSNTSTPMPGETVRQNFRLALNTSFELDFWGKLKRYREGIAAEAIASRYQRDTLALTLVSSLTQQYLQLRGLDSQIETLDRLLQNRADALVLVEKRVRAGMANELDLRQAQTALAAQRAQRLELLRSRELLNNQLVLLSGEPGLTLKASGLDELPVPPPVPAGLPSSLLTTRPDIQAAEQQLIAAHANLNVAKTAFFPSISLTGQLGGESHELNQLLNAGSRFWSLGVAVDLPLFDSDRRQAQQEQQQAREQQLLAKYRGSLRTAFTEVRDALSENRLSFELEQAQQTRLAAARALVELAQIRYQAGYVSYADVLDAQKALQEAELARIQSRADRLTASVQLIKALGGGWHAEQAVTKSN